MFARKYGNFYQEVRKLESKIPAAREHRRRGVSLLSRACSLRLLRLLRALVGNHPQSQRVHSSSHLQNSAASSLREFLEHTSPDWDSRENRVFQVVPYYTMVVPVLLHSQLKSVRHARQRAVIAVNADAQAYFQELRQQWSGVPKQPTSTWERLWKTLASKSRVSPESLY